MSEITSLEEQYIINTYGRSPISTPSLVRGEGSYLWDENGKKYLDFLSGLAVNILGHCHPAVVGAINEQADQLIHTSNLYYTKPQGELARELVENTFPGGKVFFANSGAEANEAAIKLARKNSADRYKIITAERSFHGRTLATVTATGQTKYQEPFKPLPEGFSYGRFNDLDSFAALIDGQTAAILVEPIQGEGGVYVAEEKFLQGLRRLCDENGMLLIFDEVQSGMGRSGRLWASQNWDVTPDIITAAKGLGGGLPIGAMIVREPYTGVFEPGNHASTFGGNPVVCRAALAVLDTLLERGFLEEIQEKGILVKDNLMKSLSSYSMLVKEFRGLGLMCALELKKPWAKKILKECTEAGLLINAIDDYTIRLLPPLIITKEELLEGLITLNSIFDNYAEVVQ